MKSPWHATLTASLREHGRLYYRLAWGILRDNAASEDVCQDAFAKACERPDVPREPRALKAWLATVVVNQSYYLARRRKTEKRVVEHRGANAPQSVAPSQAEDRRESVIAAMEQLPEPSRLVVTLRIMEEMSGRQVQDLVGCSAAEVSRRLHSGMDELRKLLADWKTDITE